MTKKIKKAVIEITPDKGKFLPLSSQVPKELFMLSDLPVLDYLLTEAVSVGAEEVVFWSKKKEKRFEMLFDDLESQEEDLKKRGVKRAQKIAEIKDKFSGIKFSFESNLYNCLKGSSDFSFISSDFLISAKKNSLEQLMDVFRTSERPVVGLLESDIGDIETEKIAKGLYKIKGFSDKAEFCLASRAIFTSEAIKFFEDRNSLKEAIEKTLERGHTIYGTVLTGEKFYLSNLESFLKANLHYSLSSEYGATLKDYLKNSDLL